MGHVPMAFRLFDTRPGHMPHLKTPWHSSPDGSRKPLTKGLSRVSRANRVAAASAMVYSQLEGKTAEPGLKSHLVRRIRGPY